MTEKTKRENNIRGIRTYPEYTWDRRWQLPKNRSRSGSWAFAPLRHLGQLDQPFLKTTERFQCLRSHAEALRSQIVKRRLRADTGVGTGMAVMLDKPVLAHLETVWNSNPKPSAQ